MVSPSNLYSTVYFARGETLPTRVKKALSSSPVTALSRLYSRAICLCRANAFTGSPPTRRVGESGKTTPVRRSSARSSSYRRSYSRSETLGASKT